MISIQLSPSVLTALNFTEESEQRECRYIDYQRYIPEAIIIATKNEIHSSEVIIAIRRNGKNKLRAGTLTLIEKLGVTCITNMSLADCPLKEIFP
jgi:hypothetical protein